MQWAPQIAVVLLNIVWILFFLQADPLSGKTTLKVASDVIFINY